MTSAVFGIDLGTSNTVISSCEEGGAPTIVSVAQLISRGTWSEEPGTPSVLFFPEADTHDESDMQLPWETSDSSVVGVYARSQAVDHPERVILSAKSWLSSSHVDRKGAILPWQSTLVENKISPYEASRRILRHVFQSMDYHECSPGDAAVVLTVPASFDEVARTLTYEAAREAGFSSVTVLEEPQAAFYAWVSAHEDSWREMLQAGECVLVCDVGGGTADFTMIAVGEDDGQLTLERISVGEHILLGGDNMDLALAYTIKHELEERGDTLDDWQFLSLVSACRLAKEALWSEDGKESYIASLPSRSANLFDNTISVTIHKEQLNKVILEGFFPHREPGDLPQHSRRTGIRAQGLRYATDAVLSHHLIAFLQRSASRVQESDSLHEQVHERLSSHESALLIPNKVLFNGGVFHASALETRVLDMLTAWADGKEIDVLRGTSGDEAVAHGAAYYGRQVMQGTGVRIRAGTTRAYYLGIESSMPAVPGMEVPLHMLCVAPQGMEEGTLERVADQEFDLIQGDTASFRFFCSNDRVSDSAGTLHSRLEDDMEEVAMLELSLPAKAEGSVDYVPVLVETVVNEVGVLEVWMQEIDGEGRWKLELNVRNE